MQITRSRATNGLQSGTKFFGRQLFQRFGPLDRDRPDQRHRVPGFARHWQQRHDIAARKPLARHAHVRHIRIQPGGNGFLRIGLDRPLHAKLGAAAALLAFADHRQRGFGGRGHEFDLRLVAHRLKQLLLQRGHIDDPGQRLLPDAVGGEINLAAVVAPDLHFLDRRGKRRFGPDAQGFQQAARRAAQRIRPHIGGGWR